MTSYTIHLGLDSIFFFQWEHTQNVVPLQKVSEESVIAWHTSWGPEVNISSSKHNLAPALDAGMFPLLCGLKPIKERKRSHPGHTRTVYLNHHWRGPLHFGPEPKYKQLWGERSRVFSVRHFHPAPIQHSNFDGCSGHLCWNKSLYSWGIFSISTGLGRKWVNFWCFLVLLPSRGEPSLFRAT